MRSERQSPSGTMPIQSAIFADPRQRQIIAILRERSGPISQRTLASQLAVREADESLAPVTEVDHQRILIDLSHRCLPALEAAEWIERQSVGISITEHVPVEGMDVWLSGVDDPAIPWDALAVLLAHSRRQHIMSIIAERTLPLPLGELETALRSSSRSQTTDEDGDGSTLLATLHHVDLPRLDDVGLIEYDNDEKTVVRHRSPDTISDWLRTANTGDGTDIDVIPWGRGWRELPSTVVEAINTGEEWTRIVRKRLQFILGRKST
ncbi:DUF7344 domain-containing protein [Halocatena marina]|uniref:DUF7344 domain-containing protein n=1 Tax=Halocatena marina TaxID=2934937 RepID=UPI00200BCA36|nr:hypothetical protein [Halocatena marina]